MSEIKKIGMYSTDEILEFMVEGEGRGFLGRSMFDAMYFEIERLNNIINKALRKLRASKDHFKTESENNAVTFTIKILEERDKGE